MRNRVSFLIISLIVIIFVLIINFSNLTSNNNRSDASHSSYSPATATTFNNLVPSTSHTTSLPEGFTSIGNDLSIYTPKTKETSEFGFIEVEKKSFNQPSEEYFEQLEAAISQEVEIAKEELSLSDDIYNFLNQELENELEGAQFPTTFDLRNVNSTNYITGVVNQGGYGVCWAFAIVNSLETSAFVKNITESLTPFSQVHLVNSVFNDWTFSILPSNGYSMGNFGGNAFMAPAGLQKGFSPQLESTYPYSDANQTFDYKYSPWDETTLNQHIANLSQITYLPDIVDFANTSKTNTGDRIYYTNQVSIEAVKLALMELKPVFVGFKALSNGCLSSSTNCFNGSGVYDANHAVSIVGWDDDYSKDNFSDGSGKKPPADGAFIVKNSWGSSWGNSGYFYLSYYDQSIQQLSTFDLTDLSDYTFDSYSDVGWDYTLATNSETTYTYANVFWTDDFANSEDRLYGIQFYSEDPEEIEHIQIYLDNTNSNTYGLLPNSGTLVYETSYTPGYSGMNTVFFEEAIELNPNSNYSVIITVEVPADHYATGPIETIEDYVGAGYSIVNDNVKPGQSFYHDGDNWLDSTYNLHADFLIKGIRATSGLIPPAADDKPTFEPEPNPTPTPTTSNTSDTYQDIDQLSPSRIDAIEWLKNSKITGGCDESGKLYCPSSTVNRGSMAQFLYKLSQYLGRTNDNKNAKPNFSDTKSLSASRSQAIDWLYQEGITGGCNSAATKFCPNDPVNRGSMAQFLLKFAEVKNVAAQTSIFSDVKSGTGTFKANYEGSTKTVTLSKLSAQRVGAINWLYNSNISAGSGSINNQIAFRPQDAVNRGSMAQFLKKLYGYLDNN